MKNEVTNENPNEKSMKKIILNISNLWLDANHISQVGHVKNEALQKGSIGPA